MDRAGVSAVSVAVLIGIVFMLIGPSVSQQQPPQDPSQCKYQLTLTSPVDCTHIDPRTNQALELMKRDLDRSRLTQVAQNSAVQGQILMLKTNMDQMDMDLDQIKTKVTSSLSSTPTNNADFKQLQDDVYDLNVVLVNIRDNLDRRLRLLQQGLAALNSSLVSEKVERFKVEAGLQSQVNSQSVSVSDLDKRIAALEQRLFPSGITTTSSYLAGRSSNMPNNSTSSNTKVVAPNAPHTTNNFNTNRTTTPPVFSTVP